MIVVIDLCFKYVLSARKGTIDLISWKISVIVKNKQASKQAMIYIGMIGKKKFHLLN